MKTVPRDQSKDDRKGQDDFNDPIHQAKAFGHAGDGAGNALQV